MIRPLKGQHQRVTTIGWNEENTHEEHVLLDSWPQSITQPKLNYLISDVNLSEIKAEVLPSRSQERSIPERNVNTSV
jgi:hypothetical protein